MSFFNTKQALIQQLLTVVDSSDISFENKKYDPTGKEFWCAAYFNSSTSETMGKTVDSGDQLFGFFQVSLFVPRNLPTFDNTIFQKVDLIKSAFKETTSISYNTQIVDILDSNVNDSSTNESWFQKNLTINYMTFSEK